ncbi:unnamed protein product [Euphydryas editha]|uniref:Inward rectifier potassium channel C-terminal domain-containing protein n=1 Tax=Euphydryas editha TaxID=104508 RepID=A0AAU9V3D3_EUPED|nr:unnamed protein product [Euphydryas editha]
MHRLLFFQKNAAINQRDGQLCLIFRIDNVGKSKIIATKVYASLIRYERKINDIIINYEQINLHVKVDTCDDIIFLKPISVVHKIDKCSPFYDISAQEILQTELEIVVVMEGIIESTGQPLQGISSYTSPEILWGRRFLEVIHFQKDKQGFIKDFSKFDGKYRVNTPLCRAKELDEYYEKRRKASPILT